MRNIIKRLLFKTIILSSLITGLGCAARPTKTVTNDWPDTPKMYYFVLKGTVVQTQDEIVTLSEDYLLVPEREYLRLIGETP